MSSSDSFHLDDDLARFLAAYDQELGSGDGRAPTLRLPTPVFSPPPAADDGSIGDLLPDSKPDARYVFPFPTPDPNTPFTAPTGPHRIGRFELRRQLGKGGCGIVFLAYDPVLKREVALKLPRPEMLLNADARRRLIREAHAAAEFDHPNLVPVYETGEIGPVCFIATAFCPGQTLAEWLDKEAFPVPVRQAARLVAQLAEAVQHAHERGVLHRDLKPNNVILQPAKAEPGDQGPPPGSCPLRGEHLTPRVVDFGLAKLSEGPGDTVSRQVLGTPKYMAPEQAMARHEDVGPEADVYALGVILYELLAGRPPYDGRSDVDILRQVIEGKLTPPRTLRPDTPRDLEAICLRTLARTPARRYRTAIDLADDLRRFLDGRPTHARPLNRVGRAARWLRRHDQWVALSVVSATAFFLLFLGVWHVSQNRRLRDERGHADQQQTVRAKADRQRDYARHVRAAFLSWRAGDADGAADALARARTAAPADEPPCFAWDFLARLGRPERLSVACPAGGVVALALDPAGNRVATGHADGTVAVWDRATGTARGSVQAHPAAVTHLAFAGGATLFSAGGERSARAWAVGDGGEPKPALALPPCGAVVTALAVSPDGKRVYLGTAAGECECRNVAGGKSVKTWATGGADGVTTIVVSPDGMTVATASRAGAVRLWDARTFEPTGGIHGSASPVVAFVPAATVAGGWLLAAADAGEGVVRLLDARGHEVRALPGHGGPVAALAASADGATLAAAGADGTIRLRDVSTGASRVVLRGHERAARGVQFGPDGRSLVSGGDDGQLKDWELTPDPEGSAVRGFAAAVTATALNPDGRGFAVALADGSVEIYPEAAAAPRRIPAGGRGPVIHLGYPQTGPPVGVEATGRAAVVWEFGPTPRVILRAAPPDGAATTAADFTLHGDRVVVGDDRGRVTAWQIAEAGPGVTFDTGLATPVRHLCVSRDGTRVASPTAGNAVGVWAVGDARPAYRVAGHGDGLWLVRFLPAGDHLVTAGRGSSIKVWDVASGREDAALLGHVGRVTGLAASPDGRILASGGDDGEVKLWDVRTGQELVGVRRHAGPVGVVAFAPDGRTLVTGGAGGGRGELIFWGAARE